MSNAQHVLNKENLKIENKIITEMKGKVDLENYISIVNENDVYVVNENHRGSKKVKYKRIIMKRQLYLE